MPNTWDCCDESLSMNKGYCPKCQKQNPYLRIASVESPILILKGSASVIDTFSLDVLKFE